MTKLILYLLESSIVLACLYLLYTLVLSKETFFSLNRFFLIGILVFSCLFPCVSVDFNPVKATSVERPIEQISKVRMSYYETIALWEFNGNSVLKQPGTTGLMNKPLWLHPDWIKLLFTTLCIVYALGVVVSLSRTAWTLRWIWKLINTHPHEMRGGIKVIKISYPLAPFSFLTYVFVHDTMINTPEFDQILAHEKTHIRQRHSIDLIFVQLLAAFLWFNPVIWQLIKSLKTTHEYIVDKKMIDSGYSLVEYQTLLLRQLISSNSFGLVHNFNLSFIKKRITMMRNKQSGWPGKVKVTMAIICAAVFSLLIVQCNSKLEEQTPSESGKLSAKSLIDGVDLPVLPQTGHSFEGDLTDALNFTIAGNNLAINGESYTLDQIVPMIERAGSSQPVPIIMKIDKDQTMGFVRDVQMELRKADRRLVLYLGQSMSGAKVEISLLLPPLPDKEGFPNTNDRIKEGKTDLLKIDLGDNAKATNQQKVYDFVKSHIQKQSSEYVVSVRYDDDDTYQDYLLNLAYIKEGFNQIYQERAQEMFGKDFYKTEKEEYIAVRKDVPTIISVAEN